MNSRQLRPQSLTPLLFALAACGGQTLDVGSNGSSGGGSGGTAGMLEGLAGGKSMPVSEAGTGSSGGSDPDPSETPCSHPDAPEDVTPLAAWPDPAECQPGSSPLQGTWSGYVQGHAAGAYPDAGNFSLTLVGDDDALCGSLTFGPPMPLAPATDPEADYPPGRQGGSFKFIDLLPGYSYQLLASSVSGERVQFHINLAEIYQSWCELQTPYFDFTNGESWKCARNLGAYPRPEGCRQVDRCTGEEFLVSCEQLGICSALESVCVCNAERCQADVDSSGRRDFDIRLEGDEGAGELNGDAIFLQRD